MGLEMERDSVSSEENNLLRLIYVIKKPCTECLRHVLKINVPSSSNTDVKHAVSSNQIKLQKILTKEQNSKIFPQNKICPDFDVHKCDMSLLYTLIRNISSVNPPTTGWDKPVNNQPRDTSIGANVERLRKLRNDILHENRHEITDSDFNNFWTDIETSLADIDHLLSTTFKQDVLYLRTFSLEKEFVQKEITNIRTRTDLHEIKEVQNEHKGVSEETRDQVDRCAEMLGELLNTTTSIKQQLCRKPEYVNAWCSKCRITNPTMTDLNDAATETIIYSRRKCTVNKI